MTCNAVKQFWILFKKWWQNIFEDATLLSEQEILLGYVASERYSHPLNFILILAKKHIHDTKLRNNEFQHISFLAFLLELKQQLFYEKQISVQHGLEQTFDKLFGCVYENV